MTLRNIDTLADQALQDWATRRSGTDAPQIAGWQWRGTRPWPYGYAIALRDWGRNGLGRPPAFQDGRARPEQLLPGSAGAAGAVWADSVAKGGSVLDGRPVEEGKADWTFWLLRSGRGFGKTETGAQTVIEWAKAGASPILIAGATSMDVRASMVEGPGESALLKVCPADFYPHYEPSKRKLTFPNGAECQLLSAEEPERFRGVQFVKAWCVAAGALIETERGPIPVEEIRLEDRVWTRKGLRRVRRAGLTKRSVEVWEIETTTGSVRLTPDHRVWYEGGWATCAEVREHGTMYAWKHHSPARRLGSIGTGSAGTECPSAGAPTEATTTTRKGFSIGRFGSLLRGLFQTASGFIIKTGTPQTTRSPISRRSLTPSTSTPIPGSHAPRQPWPPLLVERGSSRGNTLFGWSAKSAGKTTTALASVELDFSPDTAEKPVGMPSRVVAVRKLGTPSDVYDLSIEGESEFFANGLLVHNCDEIANWALLDECWRQIRYVMRVKRPGVRVQLVLTTTPRAKPLIRQLSSDPRCVLTVRSSYDNMANLADEYRDLIASDEGTRFGRQEIHGEVLEDIEGALWSETTLDRSRLSWRELQDLLLDRRQDAAIRAGERTPTVAPGLDSQVVAVDPPGGRTDCGIVVAGFWRNCPWAWPRCPGHLFVLADATETERPTPERWAPAVVAAYTEYHCDRVVAESNYGGDMVRSTISTEDPNVRVEMVTATRGKRVRAEPISNLWTGEHPRGHIVGRWPALEQELTTWVPDTGQASPNRMDAMVWAGTALALSKRKPSFGPSGMSKESNWRR